MPDSTLYSIEQGRGPALVLLHPVGLDHSFWGALPERWAASHRVVSLDLRGHGRSAPARQGLSVAEYAADIHRLIVERGYGPATVLGVSFGGMVAQMLALDHPADVSALILCGCPGGFADNLRPILRERGLVAEREGMTAVAGSTIERWFNADYLASAAVQRVRERLLSDDVEGWSAAWHAIADFEVLPRLGEVRMPTLIIAGERDLAAPAATTDALARAIPQARLVTLANAPHIMQLETEAAFGETVGQFLGETSAR